MLQSTQIVHMYIKLINILSRNIQCTMLVIKVTIDCIHVLMYDIYVPIIEHMI